MMRPGESGSDRVPLDAALRALRQPEEPPRALEDQVVARLGAAGALASGGDAPAGGGLRGRRYGSRGTWLRAAAAAIAGVALFAAGVVAGSRPAPASADGPRYALLLLPGPALATLSADEELERVARYRAWAGRLAADDRLVLAEKLGATVGTVAADGRAAAARPSPADEVLGFFIIVADSDADALAAARESPHAAEGGRIVVVRIEST
jgi:hypothetical protein